jgi:hypothetical protein
MLQINPGEVWLTRGGARARIYAVDGWEAFPIHGAVFVEDEWFHEAWRDNGNYSNLSEKTSYDLVRKLDAENDNENA